jgi:hypothetical protein
MKQSQYDRLAKLLTRKRGATAMDMVQAVGTVSPHRRLFEMRQKGWRIWREAMAGKNYGTYRGVAPHAQ